MADGRSASVVRFAAQQRAAGPDDPTCVICGRYGEYICDATDDDVCSLECRDMCTKNHGRSVTHNVTQEEKAPAAESLDIQSSCCSVKRKASHDEEEKANGRSTENADSDVTRANAVAVEMRKQLNIHVEIIGGSASDLPLLCDSFESLPVELRKNLKAKGFEHPTPVQMQTIPAALTGSHVLVSAPTGTGKTAAFLVPVLVQIMELRFDVEGSAPLGLVLAPIRELAIQIEDEAKALMKGIAKMRTALVVGGLPLPPQLHRLRQGVQLIVATPGRLVDIMTERAENGLDELLDSVRCCVVDEVDMMLSVGFRDTVTQLVGMLGGATGRAQLIFTSATITKEVETAVSICMGPSASYTRIRVDDHSVGGNGSSFTINPNVDHAIRWLEENEKKKELFRALQTRQSQQTLVFVESRAGADMLAEAIEKQFRHLRACSFHAGKSQQERLQLLENFVDEKVHVLVSTNVLGRGIDMLAVDCVVIFDAPKTSSDYVHLIGRVGRGVVDDESSLGASVLYVNARDTALFPELVKIFRQHRLRIPEEVYCTLRSKSTKSLSNGPESAAVDEAKRAFRLLHDDLSDRALSWGLWKYSSKRRRNA